MKRIFCLFAIFVLFGTVALAQSFNPSKGPFGQYVYSIAFDTNGRPIAGAYDHMWRQVNDTTWSKIILYECCNTYPTVTPYRPILSNNQGKMWQVDDKIWNDGIIWQSTDNGVTWGNIAVTGLPTTPLPSLAFDSSGYLLGGSWRVSSVGGGVYRSTDDGATWTLLGTDSTRAGLDTVGVLSVGTREANIFAGTAKGLYRSTNNGVNWTKLSNIFSNAQVVSVAFNSGGDVFIGTGDNGNGGLYRSTDNGANWTEVLHLGEHHFTSVSINSSGTIFVAGLANDGLYRSTNNGDTWQTINSGLLTDLPDGLRTRIIAVNQSGTVFAGTEVDGIFKSTNSGDSWVQIGIPLSTKTIASKDPFVFVDGLNPPNGTQLHRSTNNGSSWNRVNIGVVSAPNTVAIDSMGNILVGTSANGLRKSTNNGSSWSTVTFPTSGIQSLAVHPDSLIFVGTSGNGIYKSTNSGTSWVWSDSGITNTTVCLTTSKATSNLGYIFAGTLSSAPGGVYRSTDNGATWTKPSSTLDVYTITSLSVNDAGEVFAGTSDGVFKSTNSSETWTGPLSTVAKNNVLTAASGTQPTSVLSLVSKQSTTYAGTNGNGLFRSLDNGNTWEVITNGLTNAVVSALTIDDGGYLVLGTEQGVFLSSEPVPVVTTTTHVYSLHSGWNMMSVPIGLDDYSKSTLFPEANSSAFGYNNTYIVKETLNVGYGYWLKFNGTPSISLTGSPITTDTFDVQQRWNMIGSITYPVPVLNITSDPPGIVTSAFYTYNGSSYETTDTIKPGVGYWVKVTQVGKLILANSGVAIAANRIRITSIGELPPPPPQTNEAKTVTPTEFKLYQNYPNPWNPTTKFAFDLPDRNTVNIKVFNTLGQTVLEIGEKMYEAGTHEVTIDGTNWPSGIYFYQIHSGSFRALRKMILLK
ncbi:T9SS type A sorting domain-containing protein [Candidatus Jorgensenbacteria bacterium]|nr:T9SS type A sorting domain-containing protein [Candidatus Jorgensenbacteria bacterium]